MRPKSVRSRHRALRVAFAVSWASSLQLTGCLNNSTRSDLAVEAEKAAQRAEHGLAEQKVESKVDRGDDALGKDAGRVALSGGEIPVTDSPILRVAGESTPDEKKAGFWSFLNSSPHPSGVKDPFADADAQEAKAQQRLADAPRPAPATPSAGKARPAATVPMGSQDLTEKETAKNSLGATNSPEWFEKAFPAKPSFAESASRGDFSNKPGSQNRNDPFAQTAKPKSEFRTADADTATVGQIWAREQPANTAGRSAQGSPVNTAGLVQTPGSTQSVTQTGGRSQPVRETDSITLRQQKLRVQALLSEAHTNSQRGELHAAYRCALLAEKIANEHHLQFAEHEESPQTYARTIAAQIWRTSNDSEEYYLAASEPRSTPPSQQQAPAQTLQPELKADTKPDSFFGDDSFAMWEALPEKKAQQPKNNSHNLATSNPAFVPAPVQTQQPVGQLQVSQQSLAKQPALAKQQTTAMQPAAMPEIRPWNATLPTPSSQPPRELSNSAAAPATIPSLTATDVPAQKPQQPAALPQLDSHPTTGTENGVQFAIAHTVTESSHGKLSDPFAGSNTTSTPAGQDGRLASIFFEKQRPVLMAPPTPVETAQAATSPHDVTWDALSHSRDLEMPELAPQTADSNLSWRVMWSVLGLLGAGVATFIGLKISRMERNDESRDREERLVQAPPPSADASPIQTSGPDVTPVAGDAEETEIQPLQFKRAA